MRVTILIIAFISIPTIIYCQKEFALETENCQSEFNAGNLKGAYDCFNQLAESPYSQYMCAVIADSLKNAKKFKLHSKYLISKKHRSPVSFKYYYELQTSNKKKMKTIDKGIKLFKNDTLLIMTKYRILKSNSDYEAQLPLLSELISRTNSNYDKAFIARGNVFLKLDNKDSALRDLKKAYEIDSTSFSVNYNIAVVHFNEAVSLYKIADNKMDYKSYLKYKKPAEQELKMAVYYLEKADKIKPNDKKVKAALKKAYFKLGNNIIYENTSKELRLN